MNRTLFVAFSHTLQPLQIEGLKSQYGIEEGDIVLLSKVNPTLAATLQQIDPCATLVEIKDLAAQVVLEAVNAQATHFFCTGEPTLAMWANLYASAHRMGHKRLKTAIQWSGDGMKFRFMHLYDKPFGRFVCIVSTTERKSIDEVQADGSIVKRAVFNHMQWRELF